MSDLQNRVCELAVHFSAPPRALVVEDDQSDAELVRRALTDQNCEVQVVGTGERALEIFEEQNFDIVFLDLKLPTLPGTEVLRRAHELMPRTPVVIITGYPGSQMVEEATRLGFVELAAKPLNREVIVRIFNTHKIHLPKA